VIATATSGIQIPYRYIYKPGIYQRLSKFYEPSPQPRFKTFLAQETALARAVRSAGAVHALRNPRYTPQVGEGRNLTTP
jgi:hypothetical protein